MHFILSSLLFFSTLFLYASDSKIPLELQGIGVTEHLGDKISADELYFNDENGQRGPLSRFFTPQKPVLLSLVYYECPNLCHFLLNGLLTALKNFSWTPGKEFELITLSIDPKEDSSLAAKKKQTYIKEYNRPQAEPGWHFLTGQEDQIKKLASQLGFNYRYDKTVGQFAHSAVLFMLTPDGKISRYLYGVQFSQNDLKLSLLEASKGKVGTIIDRILLFCYRYDPQLRKYSLYLTRLVQLGSAFTVLLLGSYLSLFWWRQRKRGVLTL